MAIINLVLKKKWFDLILSGEKKEEYREMHAHNINIFTWHEFHGLHADGIKERHNNGIQVVKESFYDRVRFRHGYGKNAPEFTIECKHIGISTAKPEWSDNAKGEFFIIILGEIIDKKL